MALDFSKCKGSAESGYATMPQCSSTGMARCWRWHLSWHSISLVSELLAYLSLAALRFGTQSLRDQGHLEVEILKAIPRYRTHRCSGLDPNFEILPVAVYSTNDDLIETLTAGARISIAPYSKLPTYKCLESLAYHGRITPQQKAAYVESNRLADATSHHHLIPLIAIPRPLTTVICRTGNSQAKLIYNCFAMIGDQMNETNRWLDGCGDIMIMISARGRSSFSLLPESLISNYLLAVTHKYDHHTNAQLYMWHGLYVREIMHTSCHQYGLYGLSLSNDRLHAFSLKITANLTFLPCLELTDLSLAKWLTDSIFIRAISTPANNA
ncbi:hypothetical protein BD769DRAFT_1717402 [Suillus cothurnatus]|nr:hypothetical protein BD769DRAFT_1717402 [Suillus cothurnatus]